jgi:crossover junction endodeoxyribonuclease RuvC
VMTAVLRLDAPPRSDAADALAIAMTHANASGFAAALASSGAQPATRKRPRRPPVRAR